MNTFPTFVGLEWDVKKRILTKTAREEAASGASYSTSRWPVGLYHCEFDLSWSYMSQADRDTFEAFFIAQNGPATPFLLSVTNDNSKTALQFGIGNSNTLTFSSLLPPQTNVVSTVGVYANGVAVVSGIATPASPALTTVAGGTKPARTNFVRIAYRNAAGGESPASAEASIATALNFLVKVTSPAASPGAVDWRVYVATATNTETLQATLAIGTDYTEPTSALLAGVAYSLSNRSTYTVNTDGSITFTFAPLTGLALTWSGTYAYVVQFTEDELEFNQIWDKGYEQEGITFRTFR